MNIYMHMHASSFSLSIFYIDIYICIHVCLCKWRVKLKLYRPCCAFIASVLYYYIVINNSCDAQMINFSISRQMERDLQNSQVSAPHQLAFLLEGRPQTICFQSFPSRPLLWVLLFLSSHRPFIYLFTIPIYINVSMIIKNNTTKIFI